MSDFYDGIPEVFLNDGRSPFELRLRGLVGNEGLLAGALVWLQQAPDSFF
jgi:hypothetical protein